MLILEYPHIAKEIAVYARSRGRYIRPIRGKTTDLRIEDMGIMTVMREKRLMNLIGRLPDIPQAQQIDTYIVTTFGASHLETNHQKIKQLLASNQFILLPDSRDSELWYLTNAPWWEYCELYDEYDMPIKAAKASTTKFTPENVDERLDEFEENRGRIDVLSPMTLEKMLSGQLRESYLRKLRRLS